MAHEIHKDQLTGEHALYLANEVAWHKLGQVVEGARTWDEVIKLAHLDWDVDKRPLYGLIPNNGYVQLPTWGIFRTDTNAFLGSVGSKYTTIQNQYAFEFVDTILEAEGGAKYESAGALGRGERIFVSAKIPHDFTVGPTTDKHETYLILTTSHDGSLATQCFISIVRPVCNNTVRAAISSGNSFVKIKHTKDADKRMDAAKQLMTGVVQSVSSVKDKLETLGQKIMDKETYVRVLNRLFPMPKGKEDDSSTRRNNVMLEITRLFESNDKDAFPVHRGTGLNLLNAITEYTDHYRGTRITEDRKHLNEHQARAETSIFGSGAVFKEDAMEILLEETVGCKDRPYKTFTQRAIGSGDYTGITPPPQTGLLDSILDSHN